MTQIHYENISLQQLMLWANCIFVVTKQEPFINQESVSILPKDSQFSGKNTPPYHNPPYHDANAGKDINTKNYPPYHRARYHFKIVRVLLSSNTDAAEADSIVVNEAHSERKLSLHEDYYLDGRRKSPLYKRYNTSLGLEDVRASQEMLVFLRYRNNHYEFAAEDAYEGLEIEHTVLQMIADKKSGREPPR